VAVLEEPEAEADVQADTQYLNPDGTEVEVTLEADVNPKGSDPSGDETATEPPVE
jgi:hypothetical protein